MKQENVKSNNWEIFSSYLKQIKVPAKTILILFSVFRNTILLPI